MLAERPRGWLHEKRSGEAPAAPPTGPTDPRGTLKTGGRSVADQVERIATTVDARGGRARRLAGAVAPAVAHAHRRIVRAPLALVALGGAAWFAAISVRAGAVALGFTPAHGFARALAAIILAPAAAAFAVPLLDAYLALALGRDRPSTWSRIMAAACAALLLACPATVLDARLWPGIAALGLVAVLGYLFGFRHWQPRSLVDDRPARPPVVLLLIDEPRRERRAARPSVLPVPSERKAA